MTIRSHDITADEWFSQGRRVYFDPKCKRILSKQEEKYAVGVAVFERVVTIETVESDTRWVTMLPGFPDGSYGWSKVDGLLNKDDRTKPRLYVEYVGQGDSDKPKSYKYSTLERADIVEAQWRAHGVRRTVLVTFDYSSIVMMELLQRQRERIDQNLPRFTHIEHVLSFNGGFFVDGHSHPWTTTPLLKTPMGKLGTWAAQRSLFVFNNMLSPLFSKEYGVTKEELKENYRAITRHNGTAFMSNAAGFVDEHKRNSKRWDLRVIYDQSRGEGITFILVGSMKDQFEHKQIVKARERLGRYDPDVEIHTIPGGHMSTSEQPEKLAEFVSRLAVRP